MIIMSVPAQAAGSARSAAGTPRNVASGPYSPPIRVMSSSRRQSVAPGAAVSAAAPGALPREAPAEPELVGGADRRHGHGRGLVHAAGGLRQDPGERSRQPPV